MRTTIDLPDVLFREVKATAAARGLKLKELVISALQAAIRNSEAPPTDTLEARKKHLRLMREHFQRMDEGRSPHEPVGGMPRDSLHDRHA